MKTHDNRSALVANLSLVDNRDPWTLPSRCKRPPLKKPPTLLERLLQRLREGRK